MSARDDLRRQHPSTSYSGPRRDKLVCRGCTGQGAELHLTTAAQDIPLHRLDYNSDINRQADYNPSGQSTRRVIVHPEGSLHYFLIHILLLMVNQLFKVEAMEPVYPVPVFLPWPVNVTARPGERAVLPCAVHYLGTKQVTWRKLGENHFLSVGDQTWVKDPNLQLHYNEITADVTEWNLVIRNATEEHSGTYECRISDSKQLIRYVDLNVTGIPVAETATIPPIAVSGKNYVDRGQAIHLFCNTTGPIGAHLKIDWFKDGDRIDYRSYRQVVITNYNLVEKNVLVSELLIDRSQETDTGTYICRSASGHIESIKVTVLLADTNNVKRGYASNRESSSAASRQCLQHIVLIAVFLSSSLVS
ncbi:zwei Ig domain protein zig-8-like isoform X2 [Biomphalaria glabrata]|uniref:Zwei Ig domain protein zig-8-like isoform X2 n=1 Tax=Biomphalaria glabrata TaxID=6526 RepID=A0A9W3AQC8_BIOGL|nr:zwei Ig domain protein zig-8-like isoform X2 [Biomphalaria glabrata]